MVAYSFQKEFEPKIMEGSKRWTLRAFGKRPHARVGQQLQLFCGLRTKHCRKIITDRPCIERAAVILFFAAGEIVNISRDGKPVECLDSFAVCDGFDDISSMGAWWQTRFGLHHYSGTTETLQLIGWQPDLPGPSQQMGLFEKHKGAGT